MDFGEYGTLTYDIFSDEMKEYFSIDKAKGEIVTKICLDREDRKMYEVPIIATDGGGRSGFTTIKVRVGDQNDNIPQFYLREYKTSFYGNLSMNATFLNVSTIFMLIQSSVSTRKILLKLINSYMIKLSFLCTGGTLPSVSLGTRHRIKFTQVRSRYDSMNAEASPTQCP